MALLNTVTGGRGASSAFSAFTLPHALVTSSRLQTWQKRFSCISLYSIYSIEGDSDGKSVESISRRQIIMSSLGSLAGCLLNTDSFSAATPVAVAASSQSGFADMPAIRDKDYGKTKMRYPDYTETETGLQFKDLRTGTGPIPKAGETVVVIPAFEEAVSGMSLGGIRRIIVPPELGYPESDFNKKGPRPTTFSGQRALDFVLRNQGLIDKTLLFDIELIKILPN